MSACVVDSSVAAKWIFEEDFTEPARRLLRGSETLHAPDFCLLELDNVMCKRIRRGVLTREHGLILRTGFRRFAIQLHPTADLVDPAWAAAVDTGSSPYDCLYLVLALALSAPLVTADRRLFANLTRGHYAAYVRWVEDTPATP